MTLSFQYHENTGEGGREDRRGKGYFHHFHSKQVHVAIFATVCYTIIRVPFVFLTQYQEIYTCLQKLKC